MTTPAKINFKIYQGTTFNQALRWETETKTYVPITNIAKSAPLVLTVADASKLPPVGWRVRITNVIGMKEANMPTGVYQLLTSVDGADVTLNQLNSLAYSTYTSGGILEYNTPAFLVGYTARMQVRSKLADTTIILELNTANGGIVIDNTYKTINIKITAEQTALLSFAQAVYDLELIDSSGNISRFAEGTIALKQEVTR